MVSRAPLLSLALLALTGCAGSSTAPPEEEEPRPKTVTISPARDTLRAIGATRLFTATVRDQLNREMSTVPVSWSSTDERVATIDATGLATAVGPGTATVIGRAGVSAIGWADLAVVVSPLAIKTSDLPNGVVGLPYDVDLEAEGATTEAWTVMSGTLPAGLELETGTGRIHGTPTAPGPALFTILLTSGVQTAYRPFRITIASGQFGADFGAGQFALIPAGSFQMGSTNGDADERPVHTVNITKPFHLQKTEVTQYQWMLVMGANPSSFRGCGQVCPVDGVSWNDVQAFIAALNQMDPGKGYRLPTEAEWEYAARAGTTGDYGGTGVLEEMGWYLGNGGSQSHFVALKAPNAWGLYDMHGNVMEWVQDYYAAGYYAVSPADDPPGPATGDPYVWGSSRIFRGGSADRNAATARSADRMFANPTLPGYSLSGFRLARSGGN